MKQKKRLPIEQLREAGRVANEMLKKKGIYTKESTIDRIEKDPNGITLPGLPAYIPYKWTIESAQLIMYKLLQEWKTKKNRENIADFFTFVVQKLKGLEKKARKEQLEMKKQIRNLKEPMLLSEIFSPQRKKQAANAMNKFFVDSFAVSIIVKKNDSVGNYAAWFLNEWTPKLLSIWDKQNE